ncbi:ionotropic receptor 25a-like isoform X2 [Panonychus citri]|nr:ionotropic receptor 25a-like isoform X2 [Panonychus citri]
MRIPMVTISTKCSSQSEWVNVDSIESQFLVNFQSPLTILIRSLIDITEHFQINSGHIFYQNDMADYVPCLMKESSLVNFTFQLINFSDNNNSSYQNGSQLNLIVNNLVRLKVTNFLTIGQSSFINKLLETFRVNNLFKEPYKLIVISKDSDKIKCFSCKHGQLIVGQPIMSPNSDYDEPSPSPYFNHAKLLSQNVYEFYYYHDLTHLILRSIDYSLSSSGQIINSTVNSLSPGETIITDKTSCWKNWPIDINSERNNDLITIPFVESIRDFGEQYYGKLGPFRLVGTGENNNLLTGYQEISIRLKKQQYQSNEIQIETLSEWEYGLPYGRVYFTAKQSEGNKSDSILKIGLFMTPPFVVKRINETNVKQIIYEGFLIELFEEIKRRLETKFPEYEFEESSESSIGILEMDEDAETEEDELNFNGLISEIFQNDYQMALAPVEITEDRQLVSDFSEPIFDLIGFSILMKKPIKESHVWKFITVLEPDVWLCITGAYLFTSILLAIFDRFSPYSYRNRPERYESENEECKRIFTFKEALWFCFISLTPQGGGDAPKCISGRLVAAIWWLFGFIFVASYTANLAAFLTVSRLENRVDTMDGLAKQYKIRYAPVENSAADSYFIKMAQIEDKYYDIWKNLSLDDSITEDERANLAVWEYPVSDKYTKIKAQIVEITRPGSIEEGFKRVRSSVTANEGFAFISSSLDIDYLTYLNCDVYKAGDDWAYHPIAFPISKKEPYNLKELIDPVIRELKAEGYITALRIKYWEDNPARKTCPDWRKLSNGLVLADTWGMFLIVLVGLIATMIFISVENFLIICLSRRNLNSSKSTSNRLKLIKF